MKDIVLHANWHIKAPLIEIQTMLTDFEKWPEYFPNVADSICIIKRNGNFFEIDATVKSFGQKFPVHMKTQIIPSKGFISDNESPIFGTSGHEELTLSQNSEGTTINYRYRVSIHKRWLRIVAKPLIGWFAMKFWQKSVIDEIRKRLEK